MFQGIISFLRRHKRKFVFLGTAVSGIVLVNIYFRRKLAEWNAKQILEHLEQLKRQSHFDGTLETCDSTLPLYLIKVREIIGRATCTDSIIKELKNKPSNKLELWEELKIMIFTQVIAETYVQCLLVILLRVQLCILAGCIYVEFKKKKNANSSSDNRQIYLSHFLSFIDGGIKDFLIPIEDAVRHVIRNKKLDDKMKLNEYDDIFNSIKTALFCGNGAMIPNIAHYFMINNHNEKHKESFLDKICWETKDVLECDDFRQVLMCSLDHGNALLMDRMSECYMYINNKEKDGFLNPNNLAVPLAKTIPIMCQVFDRHKPDESGSLVSTLLQQEYLKTFSANLYEAFSQEAS